MAERRRQYPAPHLPRGQPQRGTCTATAPISIVRGVRQRDVPAAGRPGGHPRPRGGERHRHRRRPRARRPGGHRRPPRGVPAPARRARRAGHGDGVERRAGGRLRRQLRQAAQGPVLHRLARHPRGRLRGRPAAAAPGVHPRPHPPPVRRARRDRQPRPRAGRLRRVRRPRLPGHGAVRRRSGPGRHQDQRHRRGPRARHPAHLPRARRDDRHDRHARPGRSGRLRSAGPSGCLLHLELRPGRPPGTRAGGGAEGGPCRGAADPGLPRRAPAPRRPGRWQRP